MSFQGGSPNGRLTLAQSVVRANRVAVDTNPKDLHDGVGGALRCAMLRALCTCWLFNVNPGGSRHRPQGPAQWRGRCAALRYAA